MSVSSVNRLNIYELVSHVVNDSDSLGRLIGISDQNRKIWMLAIYIGNENMAILYNGASGINKHNIQQLTSIKNLVKADFLILNFSEIVVFDNFKANEWNFEFFHYKLNLFQTSKENKLNTIDFVRVIEHNLIETHKLDEGDIISFERGFYSHHALLTDKSRMIVTHRFGEPENATEATIALRSIFGFPTEKALVSEDNMFEVAGYRRILNGSHLYDKKNMPRPKEEILKEAKKRVGEKGYSVRVANCQHFCGQVRNGTDYSPEVQGVVDGAKYTALVGLGALALAGAWAYLSKKNNDKNKSKESPQIA